MANSNFGHCKHCKYFNSPAPKPLDLEEARCNEPKLKKFELRVFGAGGCSAFQMRQGLSTELERPLPI